EGPSSVTTKIATTPTTPSPRPSAWTTASAASSRALGIRTLLHQLPLELGRQHRLLDRIEEQLEADHRRRGVGVDLQGVLLHREHGDLVAVRAQALGRAGAAIAGRAEVGAGLQCALREKTGLGVAGIELELADAGRDVDHHPVPEARAG